MEFDGDFGRMAAQTREQQTGGPLRFAGPAGFDAKGVARRGAHGGLRPEGGGREREQQTAAAALVVKSTLENLSGVAGGELGSTLAHGKTPFDSGGGELAAEGAHETVNRFRGVNGKAQKLLRAAQFVAGFANEQAVLA